MKRTFTVGLLLLLIVGCNSIERKQDFILYERDLIPEGTAYNEATGSIFVGSTYKRKIVEISANGTVTDFIPEQKDSIFSLVGMEVDENRGLLWVNTAHANEVMPLKNPLEGQDWLTTVTSLDLNQKKIVKVYRLPFANSFLNDLTVASNGDVFVTETMNAKLYWINAETDSLELFLETKEYNFLNGITQSKKSNSLFVSSAQGVIKIDPTTRQYSLLKCAGEIDAKVIDGLTYYNGKLIGHQSSKVSVFQLNDSETEIVTVEILDTGSEFDSTTTGEVGQGYYFFIVNSQIKSAINRTDITIKPLDSLKDIIVRRIKI